MTFKQIRYLGPPTGPAAGGFPADSTRPPDLIAGERRRGVRRRRRPSDRRRGARRSAGRSIARSGGFDVADQSDRRVCRRRRRWPRWSRSSRDFSVSIAGPAAWRSSLPTGSAADRAAVLELAAGGTDPVVPAARVVIKIAHAGAGRHIAPADDGNRRRGGIQCKPFSSAFCTPQQLVIAIALLPLLVRLAVICLVVAALAVAAAIVAAIVWWAWANPSDALIACVMLGFVPGLALLAYGSDRFMEWLQGPRQRQRQRGCVSNSRPFSLVTRTKTLRSRRRRVVNETLRTSSKPIFATPAITCPRREPRLLPPSDRR